VKRAWIAAGLLCVQGHAAEAGFPAIRVGDAWVYAGYEKDKRLRTQPLHFKVEIEGESGAGGLVPVHRDPRINDEQQIGQVLDAAPLGTCVADVLTGIELLTVEQCESPPRAGSRWSREMPGSKQGRTIRFHFRYVGRKRIKVPAGRFLAHRFEVEQVETTASSEKRVLRLYWYAPEVRGIVIMESQPVDLLGNKRWPRMHAELQSFTAAQDASIP
jgi:hypothetical protein